MVQELEERISNAAEHGHPPGVCPESEDWDATPCAIESRPLELQELRKTLPPLGVTGGYVCFEGMVRSVNHGKSVVHLEYEAFEGMAVREMREIARRARDLFGLAWVRVVHRVGILAIGETAVIIQVLAGHRREAFFGCHWIIDQIKARVPIWKKEAYEDGTSSWTSCTHPPQDLISQDHRDSIVQSSIGGQDFGEPLRDPMGRQLRYLRFSLIEACNLSCRYCLPEGFPEWYRHKARLSTDAIGVVIRGFRLLGFQKIRFTGGEPTIHPGALEAVRIARQTGYETIAMTTNGLLMGDLAPWVEAGLTHLNVSLDALNPETFRALTGSSEVARVQDLIQRAMAVGLRVKVNTVLLRSVNGDRAQVEELLDWALARPLTLRFIELMDTGVNRSFASTERVYGHEIRPLLDSRGLSPMARSPLEASVAGPATEYGSPVYPGRIGLISPFSGNFCGSCNRLRVTARGALKLCLFGDRDEPLDLSSELTVSADVRRLVEKKPEKHYLDQGRTGNVGTFRTIGG